MVDQCAKGSQYCPKLTYDCKISIVSLIDNPNYICYAVKPNSLVIRADSSINKCTVALYSDHNNIGKLLRDSKVKINSDKFNKWIRGIKSGSMEKLGCPAKNYPDKNETAVKTINLNVLR